MKIGNTSSIPTALIFGMVLLAVTNCLGAELIEPTRILGEPGKERGGLTIFSEPPQLEVYVDGKKVGSTPLWLRDVGTGLHTIKIAHAETTVRVEKDEILKVGLFKGSFVMRSGPEKEKPEFKQQREESGSTPSPPQSEEERRRDDLTLWEKFVNGTLKHF